MHLDNDPSRAPHSGSAFFSLKLDFPVAVSELVMFPPSAKDPQD